MQIAKTVAALFTFTLAVSAAPALEARQKQEGDGNVNCPTNTTLQCCDSVQKTVISLIPVNLGLNCVNVLAISNQCTAVTACCGSGDQVS